MNRLLRTPNLIFIALFQVLLRYCVILPILQSEGIEPIMEHWQFAILIFATVCLAAAGNVINDYFDIYIDRINRPDTIVVDERISRRNVILIHVILTLMGVFSGLYISFVTRREAYVLLFLGVAVLLWFYSTHFKRQMLVGNLVVALLTALMVYVVISAEYSFMRVRGLSSLIETSPACAQAWSYTTMYAFFAFILNFAREMIKDIEDVEGDSQYGCRTMPVMAGVENTKHIVTALHALTLLLLWIIYFFSESVMGHVYFIYYLLFLLTLPIIVNTILLYRASTSRQVHRSSVISKLTMLSGVLTTLYFYLL